MERDEAIELIRASAVRKFTNALAKILKPSVRIIVAQGAAGEGSSLKSYLGGLPRVPPGTTWPVRDNGSSLERQIARFETVLKAKPDAKGLPNLIDRMRTEMAKGPRPLLFLGQLYLDEVDVAGPLSGWPAGGTLAFFHDGTSWGYDPLDRGHCNVTFAPASASAVTLEAPENLVKVFPQFPVRFVRDWTLPTPIKGDIPVWSEDTYRDLHAQLIATTGPRPIHRCGGHPQEIQGDMRLKCQLVTNGIYCGNRSAYEDPRVPALEAGATDWQLLLQVDSDHEQLGWMWGDAGRVYFWIRRQDLEARDFDSAWAVLQCY